MVVLSELITPLEDVNELQDIVGITTNVRVILQSMIVMSVIGIECSKDIMVETEDPLHPMNVGELGQEADPANDRIRLIRFISEHKM